MKPQNETSSYRHKIEYYPNGNIKRILLRNNDNNNKQVIEFYENGFIDNFVQYSKDTLIDNISRPEKCRLFFLIHQVL